MFPRFIPAIASQLTEAASIALTQHLQQTAIATPLSPEPINTTYARLGEGNPPLLLLHGFDSSLLEFRRLLPLLSQKQETWAVDLLGFGFSDRPLNLTFSPAEIDAHLYQFWQQFIQRPVVLVGASMGRGSRIIFHAQSSRSRGQISPHRQCGISQTACDW
jgi:hypothetical protein